MQLTLKFVFNRNNRTDKYNASAIDIYVQYARRVKYISTGIKVASDFWDSSKQKITSKHKNHFVLNRTLAEKVQQIENIYVELLSCDLPISIDSIAERYNSGKQKSVFFVEWALDFMKDDSSLKEVTKVKHKAILNKFQYFAPKLTFASVNWELIHAFENYLIGAGYKQQTKWSHHTVFKSYIKKAIKAGLLKTNPYSDFKITRGGGTKTGLENFELEALENLKYSDDNPTLRTVLDIFLFACYTGMRYFDLFSIDKRNVLIQNGETIITFVPDKTKNKKYREVVLHIDILFNGKPKVIFDKYYSPLTKKVFPKFTNQPFNRALKEIADDAKIKTNLTTHIARHTFGTNLATVRPDPYFIMELMGLSEMSTALIYVHQSKARMKSKLEKINWAI